MSAFVYLLSSYGEYGAENMVATLDKTKVLAMLEAKFPATANPDLADDQAKIVELLSRPDEELEAKDGYNLTEDWGGIQLHVVRLDHIGDPV